MFVVTSDKKLSPLKSSKFDLEDDFQRLLEEYPDLLSGELIDREEPRRWLLVSREIGIPGESGGSEVWSADHLFLDQDGIPTIVEVKRQTDTRIRREVVGQMLEYAANATAYWTVGGIRSSFEATCLKNGTDSVQELQDKIGPLIDGDAFWDQVKNNLEAQNVRLLFVADEMPRELIRIVEFLNRQMNPAEVLALELRQYSGENGLRILAPTIFGQTEMARGRKSGSEGREWNEETFLNELQLKSTPQIVEAARALLRWIRHCTAGSASYGRGSIYGSLNFSILSNGRPLWPFSLQTTGRLYINFRDSRKPPFDSVAKRAEFLAKLNEIPGVQISSDKINVIPVIPMAILAQDGRTAHFLKVMDWFVEQLR